MQVNFKKVVHNLPTFFLPSIQFITLSIYSAFILYNSIPCIIAQNFYHLFACFSESYRDFRGRPPRFKLCVKFAKKCPRVCQKVSKSWKKIVK